jgi:hypothetical protein
LVREQEEGELAFVVTFLSFETVELNDFVHVYCAFHLYYTYFRGEMFEGPNPKMIKPTKLHLA